MDQFKKLANQIKAGTISAELGAVVHDFFLSYGAAVVENGYSAAFVSGILNRFLDLVLEQLAHPWQFEFYHQHILEPFNYYQFGLDLIRPLILFSTSTLSGKEHLGQLQRQLKRGDNVILFGNHQTEPDPQAIILMIEQEFPELAREMIFVAGHRVTSDPLAIPFSMGTNLLSVYSKRHIEAEAGLKEEKLLHNQRTMKRMSQLLAEGGKCIYVAPSGGRDRMSAEGHLKIAPFDPQSIEMCWLMAKKSGKDSHFYPLSLSTYRLLPPPNSIQKKLGERRHAHSTPVHVALGPEIEMESFPGSQTADKKQLKSARANYIWSLVVKNYEKLH